MAKAWTFTAERWAPGSYLYLDGERVLISTVFAIDKGRGYFRDLVNCIERAGYRVAVPTPIMDMPAILARWRFVMHQEAMPRGPFARGSGAAARWLLTSHGPILAELAGADLGTTDVWERP